MTFPVDMLNIPPDILNISPTSSTSPRTALHLPGTTLHGLGVEDVEDVEPKKNVLDTYLLCVVTRGSFLLRPVRATQAPISTRTYLGLNILNIPKTWVATSPSVLLARALHRLRRADTSRLNRELPMTQPTPPAYTAADVETVAEAIWTLDWPEGEDWATAAPSEPDYRQRARVALDALAAAGRLLPAEWVTLTPVEVKS